MTPRLGCRLPDYDAPPCAATVTDEQRAKVPPEASQVDAFDEITQQGGLGSCVLHGCSVGALFRQRAQGIRAAFLPAILPLYRKCLVSDGRWPDDVGTFAETALAEMARGYAPDAVDPYRDTALLEQTPTGYEQAAAQHRVLNWSAVARDEGQIAWEVFSGSAVLGSFLLSSTFFDTGVDGLIPVPRVSDRPAGGHLMRVVGYTPRGVWLGNSHGRSFGRNGYGFMPWEVALDPYYGRAFHAIRTVRHVS